MNLDDLSSLGKFLRSKRVEKSLSIEQVAEKLNWPSTVELQNLENGKLEIRGTQFYDLLCLYEMTADDLVRLGALFQKRRSGK